MGFLRGFLFGLAIAAPVGPIGILCIQRTLFYGRMMGFVSGLGAAVADAIYGSVAAFGMFFLSSILVAQQDLLRTIGGLFLLLLGIITILKKPSGVRANISAKNFLGTFLSTFFLTITNPMTILSFSAIFSGLGVISVKSGSLLNSVWLVLGIFCGSTAWWYLLSGATSLLQAKLEFRWFIWLNRLSGFVILGFGVVALLTGLRTPDVNRQGVLSSKKYQSDTKGYSRAIPKEPLVFPKDQGAHPDFQTEWWYFTGNLSASDGNRFGYQLTFFRRSLIPPGHWENRKSSWATNQAYLAHFAITEVSSGTHLEFERLERGAAGLAGTQAEPFQVWLDDWSVVEEGQNNFHLRAQAVYPGETDELISLDLELSDLKGPILQGDQGYSVKGSQPGNASYYYSFTRLITQGNLSIGKHTYQLTGNSWLDHEFSTNALSEDQIGWDWFSIQLENDTEIMLFQIRTDDGSVDISSGTWIAADNKITVLKRGDFQIQVIDTWRSPETGGIYPSLWQVTLPNIGLNLMIQPLITDQEVNLTYTYWEGAVSIKGDLDGTPVNGYGYVELTGYAGSMGGEF